MANKPFPAEKYMTALVRFFETIKYQDDNYDREQRVSNLRYVYSETARHFAQPAEQAVLNVKPKRFEAVMRTSVLVTVYCWTKVPLDVMVGVSVYFVYIILLDDGSGDPHTQMGTFCQDFILGQPQKHPFWQRMNEHLVNFLRRYGSFCAMTIMRSTFDFFQGCWIEQHNFHGFPGSHYFPLFLRRLNGLGGITSATLFPAEEFDERAVFNEITTAIAELEPQIAFVNDLMSFYKEYDSPRDQVNLVNNYCHCEDISWETAFERLTEDTIRACDRLVTIFKGKDSKVEATVHAFIHGYVTWHFCDERFKMRNLYEQAGDSAIGLKFRHFFEMATDLGTIEFDEWANPQRMTTTSFIRPFGPNMQSNS
ncbi:Trichodiene synthase [Elaphomyces granulatus]